MGDKRTFADMLVSQLGQPREPFSWSTVVFGLLLLLGIVTYLALEYGLVMLIKRLIRRLSGK